MSYHAIWLNFHIKQIDKQVILSVPIKFVMDLASQLYFSFIPDHGDEQEIEELRGRAIIEAEFTSDFLTAFVLTKGK